ncbi:MAG TPA: hypothetical protein VLM91_24760 [Candidatus Methylomirabilis sp.]|nr:hypothetical protein [Candidatus Methylomirabilis sp.]
MAMIPFRDLVAAQLASRHPSTEGWSVQRDHLLDSGAEVHFLASRGRESILVHCKEEAGNVLFEHVDHAAALATEAGAGSAVLYVPIGSFTPPVILAYAAKRRIRIEAL